jgi:hypothetical protein
MTRGYFNPDLTVEDVAEHLGEIRDEAGYSVPASAGEETAFLFDMMSRFNAG